jgi:hypothetical protein
MSKPKPDSLGASVDEMLAQMLKDANDPAKGVLPDEKLKIVDRALKKIAIDHKIKDSGFGSAFDDDN